MVLEGLHFKYTITDINYLAQGGWCFTRPLFQTKRTLCSRSSIFHYWNYNNLLFFPLPQLWKRCGGKEKTQWKWEASFSGISPPPSSSVYLMASLIGSAWGHWRTWLRMESPVCRVVLSNIALVYLYVSSLFFAEQTLWWNRSLF